FREWCARESLGRHTARACRLLHLLGPPASALYLGVVVWLQVWWLALLTPLPTYFLAWLGHVAAGNRPTFFEHPFLVVPRLLEDARRDGHRPPPARPPRPDPPPPP